MSETSFYVQIGFFLPFLCAALAVLIDTIYKPNYDALVRTKQVTGENAVFARSFEHA